MILRGSVFSETLAMETGLTVVTPNGLKGDRPYRIAYLLHGLCGGHGDWANYTRLPLYALEYDVVFVMPEVARSFYSDMRHGLDYFTYICEELPRQCQSLFNISTERQHTAVIGNSIGGYGALKCALSYPAQYGCCCAFASPCLFWPQALDDLRANGDSPGLRAAYGPQLIHDFKAAFGPALEWHAADDILALARACAQQAIKPRIYTACGRADALAADNRRFGDALAELGLDSSYAELDGGHDWYFFDQALRQALGFCFDA